MPGLNKGEILKYKIQSLNMSRYEIMKAWRT